MLDAGCVYLWAVPAAIGVEGLNEGRQKQGRPSVVSLYHKFHKFKLLQRHVGQMHPASQ